MISPISSTKFLIPVALFFVFQIRTFHGFSQQYTYFNSRYDLNLNSEIDRCHNIVNAENGFVISGHSIVYSGNIYWWEMVIAKIDLDGELKIVKFYGDDSVDYFFSTYPGYLIEDSNHFYAVGKKRTPTLNGLHDEGTLMNIDENLDTLWMKRYGEDCMPYDTAYLFTCIQKINNDLIISGSWKPYGLATHVLLLKTDNLGNKLWDKSFSYYNFYIEGYSIAQTTDSGFIIGCFKQTPGYPYTVDPILIKTDSIGNQQWTRNLGGPYEDSSPFVTIATDGNIVVGTSYADTMATPDNPISRINIIKIDNEGNIIWNKKFGKSERSKYLHYSRVLSNGTIVCVGSVYRFNPEPDRVSWILKTTSDGDSLWYREYSFLSGQQSRNYLYDIIETKDTGLIACGWIDPEEPDTGSIDTWVIKLDSIGCDTAGCDPTVGVEDGMTVGLYDGKKGGLEIWPNPAREILNVEFLILNSGNNSPTFNLQHTISVYDIYGRSAPTPALPHSVEGGWILDVSALPPGIYFIVVRDERSVIGTGKFVIAR